MEDKMENAPKSPSSTSFIVCLVLGFLIIKWYFSSDSPQQGGAGDATTTSTGTNAGSNQREEQQQPQAPPPQPVQPARRRPVTPDMIQVVHAISPQVTVEQIKFDLEQNGGNIEQTVDRIFSLGGNLPFPPGYRPPPAATQQTPQASNSNSKQTIPLVTKGDNLIKRYHLESKLEQNPPKEGPKLDKAKWKQSKDVRKAYLDEQRERMILNARRKLQENLAAKTGDN